MKVVNVRYGSEILFDPFPRMLIRADPAPGSHYTGWHDTRCPWMFDCGIAWWIFVRMESQESQE